nr:ComEC/Rec2 family competence protein [Qipengyuania spongiae]
MATHVPLGEGDGTLDVAVQRSWRMRSTLSSIATFLERGLAASGTDRGPWLTVAFGAGIGAWFWLPNVWTWAEAIVAGLLTALAGMAAWRGRDERANLLLATLALSLAMAGALSTIWARSAMIGAEPIEYARVERFEARILEREERPAEERVRLTLAFRDPETARALKVRVNIPGEKDSASLQPGAVIRLRARLMPPAPPILPGAYDFARHAWFDGLAATGTLLGSIENVQPTAADNTIGETQRFLSRHVRERLDGSAGTIAAAFASGDRGAITQRDEEAMRDAGLTHLLSISGLHVSAVIAGAYFLAMRLLALWPWLTLRVRLPLVAAAVGALAGIGYTLLTGAEVPTVRSCVGAVLVLLALALGREPLSMRMVAVAAMVVLLLWPESLVGPSFQMSFAAVIAIIALRNAGPVRAFLAPREESAFRWFGRRSLMLFLTGLLIEIALTPIVLFHFHRAGLYGAFANVIAIPLVTFLSMPLIALALMFDLAGLGAPAWWLAGLSLDLLLGIAHFTAGQPGAVKLVPQMGMGTVMLYIGGALWLALWRGRARLWGAVPVSIAALFLAATPTPDVLVTRDGRHVGIVREDGGLLTLRYSRSTYARDNLHELAGVETDPVLMSEWPGARCSPDFCVILLERGKRTWTLLMARSNNLIEERALAAACDQVDIVVADRFLPRSCRPRWLKADRRFLAREGGLSIYLDEPRLVSVAETQGEHGWWREPNR